MKKTNKKLAAGVGAGLAAAAAAVGGAYFFYGKKGVRHRKALVDKYAKAKVEVAKQIKKLGKIDKKTYLAMISKVAAGYEAFKDFDKSETRALVKELQGYWDSLVKESPFLKPARGKSKAKKARSARK